MNRWKFLSLALCAGAFVACSDEPQATTDAGTDSGTPTDMGSPTDTGPVADTGPTADTGPRDSGTDAGNVPRCGRNVLTNINTAGMRSGTTTRYMGNTDAAYMEQVGTGRPNGRTPVLPPASNTTCTSMTGQVALQYTTGAMPASLRISTTNAGTARNFDTVLWVTTRCNAATGTASVTLGSAACNDDDPDFAASADRRVSSLVTTEVLPANTTVIILVGGFYPPGTGTVDHGAFELTVDENVPVAENGACRVDGTAQRCGTDLDCVGADPGAAMGTCRVRGSVAGSRCATSTPQCAASANLTCETTSNTCVATAAVGGRCDAWTQCPTGSNCLLNVLGAINGTCIAAGTAQGATCRSAGSSMPACDNGLVCSTTIDPTDTTPTCERVSAVDMPCNIGIGGALCPAGSTCVTVAGGAIGTCRANGTVARTACRGSAPRCDGNLQCLSQVEGAPALCVNVAMTGGACNDETYCPDNNTCYLTDLSNRVAGRCGAVGTAGGPCGTTTTRCTAPAVCSATDVTQDGICQNEATEGMPCVRPISTCAAGLTCVLNAGSQSDGVCRRDGTVAGAECRASDPPCDTGLTCGGSFLSGGVCQAAATTTCDPLNGTTRCPGEQVCILSAYNRGACAALTGMETEPNNTPAAVMASPVTAPTARRGSLPFGDVDCIAVTVPANGRIVAQVSDGNGRCSAPFQGGIALDLYNTDGTSIRGAVTRTGPFGGGSCATIDGGRGNVHAFAGNLAAGTYYVCARGLRDATTTTGAIPSYVLSVAPLAPM